jgi:hypothetical protein
VPKPVIPEEYRLEAPMMDAEWPNRDKSIEFYDIWWVS